MIDLPEHDDVVFNSAPLVAVIAEVRFSPILSLMTAAGVVGMQEALRRVYPTYEMSQQATFTFSDQIGIQQQPPVHLISSRDGWEVRVTTNSISLTAHRSAYHSIAQFSERFDVVLHAAARTVAPDVSTRLTLSKQNLLEHPDVSGPSDWASLLNPALIGPVETLTSSIANGEVPHGQNLFHLHGDDELLEMRHGVPKGSPTSYQLDISHSTSRPYGLVQPDGLTQTLDQFAGLSTKLFHWALTDKMKDHLDPVARTP